MSEKEKLLQTVEDELLPYHKAAIRSGNRKLDTNGIEEQVRILFSHNISLLRSLFGFRITSLPLSQADFAQLMELALPTVNKWENGIALPNRSVLVRLVQHANAILHPRPAIQEADILYTSLVRVLLPNHSKSLYKPMLPEPNFGKEHFFIDFIIEGEYISPYRFRESQLPFSHMNEIYWDKEWNEMPNPLHYVKETGVSTTAIFYIKEDNSFRFFDITILPTQDADSFHCFGMEITQRHARYRAFKYTMDDTTLRMADLTIDYQQQRLKAIEAQKAKERSDIRCDILRSVTDNASEALLAIDKQGTILEENIRSIALLSQNADIVGKNFFEIIGEFDTNSDCTPELLQKAFALGFLRHTIFLDTRKYTCSFSPLWAGGTEYCIIALKSE